ncbi:hypothetical protein BDV97DRAFT_348860 [Delphinella strobiligena]|nr:hypothetical protein BDV97DRAFT_348860 [Delphinella strobiligena]
MDRLTVSDEDGFSVISDISALENDTDEFGRKLLQHTRDAQRIRNALHSQGQAFRRARPSPRIALTLDNLKHNSLVNDGRSASDNALKHGAPPSVASSTTSDPPLNVPREWGRKGRHDTAWLRRIHQEDQNPNLDKGNPSPSIDWTAAAHQPVNSSPSRPPSAHAPTPASARQHNTSLDEIMEWEADQDLTATSLLASTPALPSRTRQALDEMRQREIESIGKSTLTTRQQRQIWENTPSETRRRRSRQNLSETADQQLRTSVQDGSVSASETRPITRRRSNASNKENTPLASTAPDHSTHHVSHKSTQSIGTVDRAIQPSVSRSTPPRTQHQSRSDSMALLKRLARVSSSSPSPISAAKQAGEAAASQNANQPPQNDLPVSTSNTTIPTEVRKGESASDPDLSQQRPSISTVGTHNPALRSETPKITGAWVDTPRTDRPPLSQAPDSVSARYTGEATMNTRLPPNFSADTIIPRRRSEPHLPTSALAAVLEDMRRRKHHVDSDPTLGDSTIAELEDMINPSADDPTITLDLPDSILGGENDIDLHPTTQADRDRRQEDLALEALNNKLKSMGKSIHEASQGLRNAERHISPSKRSSTNGSSRHENVHNCSCDGHCNACGRHTSVFRAAWSEYWGLYFRWDDGAKWGMRLTWLGLACILFWSWLATETTLCSMYCQPTYAYHMRGYGVNPDAPRFPYVIPTLLFRPFKPVWEPVLTFLAWSFGALYSSDSSSAANYPSHATRKASRTASTDSKGLWSKVSWSRGSGVGEAWSHNKVEGKVQRMNAWDHGQKAWEAPGEASPVWDDSDSMLDDEYV